MLKNTNFGVFWGRRIFLLYFFFQRNVFLRSVEHLYPSWFEQKENYQLEDSQVQLWLSLPTLREVDRNEYCTRLGPVMQPWNITNGNEIIGCSKSRCSRIRFEEFSQNRPEPNYRNYENLGSQIFREPKIIRIHSVTRKLRVFKVLHVWSKKSADFGRNVYLK